MWNIGTRRAAEIWQEVDDPKSFLARGQTCKRIPGVAFPHITWNKILTWDTWETCKNLYGIQPMNEHSVIFNGLISENIYRKLASCYNQHLCFFSFRESPFNKFWKTAEATNLSRARSSLGQHWHSHSGASWTDGDAEGKQMVDRSVSAVKLHRCHGIPENVGMTLVRP